MAREAVTLLPAGRPTCARCRRPVRVCYCAALTTLETRTRVVILQHPRERDVPIGTARMASLCLPGAVLRVGARWDDDAALAAELSDPARPAVLLYPGEDARDVLAEPPAGPLTLVVVDGTWSQAKNVVRDNAVLRSLPRVAFVAPEPSQYRIRREPSDDVVSTIEALMHVLGALEADPARFRALLAPMTKMIDAQLAHHAANRTPRHKRRRERPPPRTRLPREILEAHEHLVVLAAESNAWPYELVAKEARAEEELVHCVALRVATGERVEVVAAPRGALSPTTASHTELAEEVLRGGPPVESARAALAAFLRPSDALCIWGHHALDLLRAAGVSVPAVSIDVRDAARRLTQAKLGGIESYAASLGPAPPPAGAGRAGRRVALLAQIVAAWRAL